MPTASAPRTKRELFEPAHSADTAVFPPRTDIHTPVVYMHLPTNWLGTDTIGYWFLGGATTGDVTFDFTIEAGSHREAYTTHTQTVNNHTVNVINTEHEFVDLTTAFATIIAQFDPGDMIKITLNDDSLVLVYAIGFEIREI